MYSKSGRILHHRKMTPWSEFDHTSFYLFTQYYARRDDDDDSSEFIDQSDFWRFPA